MKALIISPHTDDAELAMGATMSKLNKQGHELIHVVLSLCSNVIPQGFGEDATRREFLSACDALDIEYCMTDFEVRKFPEHRQQILDYLYRLNAEYSPTHIFIPSHNDVHQDHLTTHQEALRAFKYCTIYGYELVWNNLHGAPDVLSIVSQQEMDMKMYLIESYKSEGYRNYNKREFIFGLASMRGIQANAQYAEGFYNYRTLL